MDLEQTVRQLHKLPPEKQQEVADFVEFLCIQTRVTGDENISEKPPLADEPFVGMWKDREEMQDSVAWVRELREREWNRFPRE